MNFTPLPQKFLQGKSPVNILLFAVVVILSLVVLGGTILLVMKKSSPQSLPVENTFPSQTAPTALPTLFVSPTPRATDSATIDTSPENVDVGSIEADLQDLDKELQGL